MHYTLGLDTSGNDTVAGVVIDGVQIASDVNTSRLRRLPPTDSQFQESRHDPLQYISHVIDQALSDAGIRPEQLNAIAVTQGPGLGSSLDCGVNAAKALSLMYDKPLIGVHHTEAHIYACRLVQPFREISFPALVVLISSGATTLLKMTDYGSYELFAETTDDTIGETIEKIGRVLGFQYPAGPQIEESAARGNGIAYNFLRHLRLQDDTLSFNGIKAAVLNEITVPTLGEAGRVSHPGGKRQLRSDISIHDVAASLQTSLTDVLLRQLKKALQQNPVKEVLVVGGVAANHYLRQQINRELKVPVRYPPLHLCMNNGPMVAAVGYARLQRGQASPLEIEPVSLWPINQPL
jgi:N6-L-threonylcarbamoyladenine synthase